MQTLEIQRRLKALGFNPGPEDGAPGRLTTAAIKAFQQSKGLTADGVVGPKTLAALLTDRISGQSQTGKERVEAEGERGMRPWFDLAMRKKGLHEGRDHAEVAKFLKSDGKTLGDPAKLPWCGDFVETCIAITLPDEPLPVNPYLARNWLKFGRACEPTLGAVAVFWRGSKTGTSGHVGFVAGGGTGVLYILGGNQSNAITVAPLKNDRLLGCRWPSTVSLAAARLPTMKGGQLSINEA